MNERSIDRREFLHIAGAGALVLGFPSLARGEDGWEAGAWAKALEAMKSRKAHGVAIVVPPDAAGRKRLADQLAQRLPVVQPERGDQELAPLVPWFLECVWVLASPERAQAKEGETLVLLDAEGKRVAGAKVPLGDQAAFEKGVAELLTAEGRLQKRAAAVTTPELTAALERMRDGQGPAVVQELSPRVDELISALVKAWRDAGDDDVKTWVGSMLRSAWWRRQKQETGLPFGIKWTIETTEPEPCPPCGMAMPSFDGRKFLEFWGK